MKNSTGRQKQIQWFDDDPEFRDFNFSDSLIDPTPTQQKMAEWICIAREGHTFAADAFADAMYLTLRTAAFEAHLRTYPRKAITLPEYFHSKLRQFLRMLLDSDPGTPYMERGPKFLRAPNYSDAWLEADLPLLELKPEDNERVDWHELVRTILENRQGGPSAIRAWLTEQLSMPTPNPRRSSPGKTLRDSLIQQALIEKKSRMEICDILDRNGIPVSGPMRRAGMANFRSAWNDKKFRANIQSMVSKELKKLSRPS